jgi:hypothetical protein
MIALFNQISLSRSRYTTLEMLCLFLFSASMYFGCGNEPYCPKGLSWCWAQCVDLANDSNNCGSCDNACESDQSCSNGLCTCKDGYTNCNGSCSDTNSDPANCGACGIACESDEICDGGACLKLEVYDSDGDGYCSDSIVDQVPESDCPNDVCNEGMCTPTDCDDANFNINPGALEGPMGDYSCADGIDNDCDGFVDAPSDKGCCGCSVSSECDDMNVCTTDHCQEECICFHEIVTDGTACEYGSACSSNDNCQNGICTMGPSDKDADGDSYIDEGCPSGDDCDDGDPGVNPGVSESCDSIDNDCDGETDEDFDLSSDPDNCGSCGAICRRDNATAKCDAGICSIEQCDPLWGDCNGVDEDGCETSLETITDCGACGAICSGPGDCIVCTGGVCNRFDFADCDGNPANGEETDICHNERDCGGCDIVCSVRNGTPECDTGSCVISSCHFPYEDCDNSYETGCEHDLRNGPCNACSQEPGVCDPMCDDCDGDQANGCEKSLESLYNCGSCFTPCDMPAINEIYLCIGGICQMWGCRHGYANCDEIPPLEEYTCETLLGTVTDCGGCNDSCAGNQVCDKGTCVDECSAWLEDCSGACADTNTHPEHCGECDNVCTVSHGMPGCSEGSCIIEFCAALYDDCDGLISNGCEADLLYDPDNCRACGNLCSVENGTPRCSVGFCRIRSCDSGYDDCDRNYDTGCEVDIMIDPENCGICGVVCSVGQSCVNGVCQ